MEKIKSYFLIFLFNVPKLFGFHKQDDIDYNWI